jgi:WD40 repeat protein
VEALNTPTIRRLTPSCRHQLSALALLFAALSLLILSSLSAKAQTLYERPVLVVDPDTHTAVSRAAAADAARRFLITGSEDKTVRIWSASDGKLLRTIRMPAGPGPIGEVNAVAMSPDGNIVAAGGSGEGQGAIYLFDQNKGKMTRRIGDLPDAVNALAFSADGRYLAAGCGSGGLRVFDRDKNWSEAFRDEAYGDRSYGAAFADDGRLATSSFDGKIRLYDPSFKLVATQETPTGPLVATLAFSPDISSPDAARTGARNRRTTRCAASLNIVGQHSTCRRISRTEPRQGSGRARIGRRPGRGTVRAAARHEPSCVGRSDRACRWHPPLLRRHPTGPDGSRAALGGRPW